MMVQCLMFKWLLTCIATIVGKQIGSKLSDKWTLGHSLFLCPSFSVAHVCSQPGVAFVKSCEDRLGETMLTSLLTPNVIFWPNLSDVYRLHISSFNTVSRMHIWTTVHITHTHTHTYTHTHKHTHARTHTHTHRQTNLQVISSKDHLSVGTS